MKIFLPLFWILIICGHLSAQNQSPYDCINNHLENLQSDRYAPLQSARSFSGPDTSSNVDFAKKLKQVYDGKGLYVFIDDLPKNGNYYDSTRQRSVYYPFPSELPNIYVRSISGQWFYPPEVLEAIDEDHQATYPFGLHLLMNALPHNSHTEIMGVSLWQVVGSVILLALFVLVFFVCRFMSVRLLKIDSTSESCRFRRTYLLSIL